MRKSVLPETQIHEKRRMLEKRGKTGKTRGGQTDGETIMLETTNQRAKGAEGQTGGETIMLETNNQSQRDRGIEGGGRERERGGGEGDRLAEKQSC